MAAVTSTSATVEQIPDPADLSAEALTSDTAIRLVRERAAVEPLRVGVGAIVVDAVPPVAVPPPDPVEVTYDEVADFTGVAPSIPGDVPVSSYLLHADPVGNGPVSFPAVGDATVTFSDPIIGIMARSDLGIQRIQDGDYLLGNPGTLYDTSGFARGLGVRSGGRGTG